jgi:hypothetical protein
VSRVRGISVSCVNSKDTGGKIVRSTNQESSTTPAMVATQQDTVVRSRETETVVNDKYKDFDFCTIEHQNSDDIEFCISQIQYFEERSYEKVNVHGVKGRLSKHVKFWEEIGANLFAMDTIRDGYIIPFIDTPKSMRLENNRSALKILNLLQNQSMNY